MKQYWWTIHFGWILLGYSAPESVNAAVIRVPGDFASLLAAVDASTEGDSILVRPGTWSEREDRLVSYGGPIQTITSCAFLKGGLTIVGEAGASATIIDGGSASPNPIHVLSWSNFPGKTVTLEGLTITGASARGVMAVNCGSLVMKNCRVVENAFQESVGRGVEAFDCHLTVMDSEFRDNTGAGLVTGVVGQGARRFELIRSKFVGHTNSGAILTGGGSEYRIVTDCEFIANRAGQGGGLRAGGGSSQVLIEGNLFLENVATGSPDGIGGGAVSVGGAGIEIRFNTFVRDSTTGATTVGGAVITGSGIAVVESNTFYGCHATRTGAAVSFYSDAEVHFIENVIAQSSGSPALERTPSATVLGGCNVLWQNAGGDYDDDWDALPGDIVADPQFCDPWGLDFTVRSSSPCVEGNLPGCGPIGAWGVGCGTVSVRNASWGSIKALYR